MEEIQLIKSIENGDEIDGTPILEDIIINEEYVRTNDQGTQKEEHPAIWAARNNYRIDGQPVLDWCSTQGMLSIPQWVIAWNGGRRGPG